MDKTTLGNSAILGIQYESCISKNPVSKFSRIGNPLILPLTSAPLHLRGKLIN